VRPRKAVIIKKKLYTKEIIRILVKLVILWSVGFYWQNCGGWIQLVLQFCPLLERTKTYKIEWKFRL